MKDTSTSKHIIEEIVTEIGDINKTITKQFVIGENGHVNAAVIYINGLANKELIDRDIVRPLMTNVKEDILKNETPLDYLCEKYIYMSDTYIESDRSKVVDDVKRGKSVLIVDGISQYILFETASTSTARAVSEPINEASIKGPKEGFIENLQLNIGLIRKHLKDKNLITEYFTVGTRTQMDLALIYIDDIVDKDIVLDIRSRILAIHADSVQGTGIVEQLVEKYPYTIFPQALFTERPDRVIGNIVEGRIVVFLDGTPFAMIIPVLLTDFFQTVEDYYERTLISNFVRYLRILSVAVVIMFPSIYLILVRFNAELIPIRLLVPIIQSRRGIPFPPFLEIMLMEFVIEFLREGGIRLPNKIGQTLSVVGGFIIGSAALSAKIVSPATIVVVGIAAIATFVIPNYEMSLAIRLIRFPMLILSNYLGVLGLVVGIYVILVHLYSIDSFGVPYLPNNKYSDLKDILVRVPLWKMNKRPEAIPNNNPIRQTDFRKNR